MLLDSGKHGQHQAAEHQQKSAIEAWKEGLDWMDGTAEETEQVAVESEEEGDVIWEELSGKQINESEFPGVVPLCWMPKGEVPKLWATELRDTFQPSQLPLMEAVAQRSGHSTVSGRSVWASCVNTLAHGPTIRQNLQAQPLMSGGLGPCLSFKIVLREVPQRSARGSGKVSS